MKVLTNSINKYLEYTFNKTNDNLLLSDVLLVEYLTIDGRDDEDKKTKVNFDDLKIFKNLKYLEIRDVTVTSTLLKILANLDYLESVIFRNCKFNVRTMNNLINLKSIRIINCVNFDLSYINKLLDLERLYISDLEFNDFSDFSKLNLESLDISGCYLNKCKGLDNVSTNYLVISNKQFKDFEKKILDLDMKIMVMADPSTGFYIEKWIN